MMNTWIDRNPGIKKVIMLGVPTVAQWKFYGLQQKEVLEKRGVSVLDNIDMAAGAVDAPLWSSGFLRPSRTESC